MAVIAIQEAYAGNLDVTYTAANSGGDTIVGGSRGGGHSLPVVLIAKNGHNAAQTVTVAGLGAYVIAAGDEAHIPVTGGVNLRTRAVTYSGVVSLTVAAVNYGPRRTP
jgi:hypothetical protein